ncbi:MAG TPA: hypothetical protein VL588_11260 [Bdellovibrionota bacterium]|jgi:hypothetical protein|nr:hypothetical protein [Bdellovibrionota bacterium]
MPNDIVEGKVGAVGEYDVKFEDGKLVADVGVGKFGVSAQVGVAIEAAAVFAAIKKAIPGTIDDLVLDAALALIMKL